MQLTINGEEKTFDMNVSTVSQLLEKNNVEMPDMVSVQLNGAFVNRSEFESTGVQDGDEVEFLYFMGGGSGSRRIQNSILHSELKSLS